MTPIHALFFKASWTNEATFVAALVIFLSFKPWKFSLLELVLTFTKKRFKIHFREN